MFGDTPNLQILALGLENYCTMFCREEMRWIFFFLTQLSPENVSLKISFIVLTLDRQF